MILTFQTQHFTILVLQNPSIHQNYAIGTDKMTDFEAFKM